MLGKILASEGISTVDIGLIGVLMNAAGLTGAVLTFFIEIKTGKLNFQLVWFMARSIIAILAWSLFIKS